MIIYKKDLYEYITSGYFEEFYASDKPKTFCEMVDYINSHTIDSIFIGGRNSTSDYLFLKIRFQNTKTYFKVLRKSKLSKDMFEYLKESIQKVLNVCIRNYKIEKLKI